MVKRRAGVGCSETGERMMQVLELVVRVGCSVEVPGINVIHSIA